MKPPRSLSAPASRRLARRHVLWPLLVPAALGANVLLSGARGPGGVSASRPATEGEGQIRALWVDAFHDGIKTPAQVERLIADALSAGVNTLVVQVRRRGDAYYNRTTEPRTEDAALRPGFDALQATIERARAAQPRLEVHAWIATVALWNRKDRPPADSGHAFNRHGPDATGEENWISLDDKGTPWDGDNYMLDPGHPQAARYVASVATEIVRAYDVDGIHLDLVRYAGAQWGYNPVSVNRFLSRSGGATLPAPADARWQQWRRDQVTALVRRVYLDTMALKPQVKVSAATIGWGAGPADERGWRASSAFRNVYQDWVGWLEEGIVDVAMPMNYDDERVASQRAWYDQWTAWQRERKGKRHVVAGVGLFLNEPAGGLAQIRRALEPGAGGSRLDGVALYSYAVSNAPDKGSETPATPNGEFLRSLGEPSPWGGEAAPPFAVPALPPAMPWKERATGHLRGTVRRADGVPLDGATVRLEGPQASPGEAAGPTVTLTLVSDGNGYVGATDLAPGRYAVTVESGRAVLSREMAVVRAGEVLTLDLRAG